MGQTHEPFDCGHCIHYQYQPDDSYIEEHDVYACEIGIIDDEEECDKNFKEF